MARKRKTGDTSYNARRREYRAAQRYLDMSRRTSGATAEKNRAIAKAHLENALATYDASQRQKISAPIANLAAEFGIMPTEIRPKYADITPQRKARIIDESTSALAGASEETRRENEAKALINNPSISKRVFGGLVDIWGDKVKSGVSARENRQAIEKAIFDYFNTESWADIFDRLQQNIGEELFSTAADFEIYDYVRIALQKHVTGNTLISQ